MSIEDGGRRDALRHYAKNDLKGREKMQEGLSQEMHAWPEWWDKVPETNAVFTDQSEKEVMNRLIEPIRTAAYRNGIELWSAIADYPMHCTLVYGKIADLNDQDQLRRAHDFIQEDTELHSLAHPLTGVVIPCEYPITDGNSVMLTSSDIPTEITAFKEKASEVFQKNGFEPKKQEFLYITIARIKKLPVVNPQSALESFKRDLIRIRHEISKEPLLLTIDKTFVGFGIQNLKRAEV